MGLSNCCGCGSLKTGTLLIGSLNLVTSILGILISGWCVVDSTGVAELVIEQINPGWKEKIHETYYDTKEELEQKAINSISSGTFTYGLIFLIASIVTMTFSACLVHGTRTRNVCLMMPWIVMTGICLFLNIFNVLFSIASSPTPVNIISSTGGWGLGLYFFIVVCAFKAELEKGGQPGSETLPHHVDSAPPAHPPTTGFLDLPTLKRELKMKTGSDNINYQPFH